MGVLCSSCKCPININSGFTKKNRKQGLASNAATLCGLSIVVCQGGSEGRELWVSQTERRAMRAMLARGSGGNFAKPTPLPQHVCPSQVTLRRNETIGIWKEWQGNQRLPILTNDDVIR
jgi:hypothetical protein